MEEPAMLINVQDYHQAAQKVLSKMAYSYYKSGADDEITLRENNEAFKRILMRQRVLRDVAQIDTRTYVLGTLISTPIMLAPAAMHGLANKSGEVATAIAAEKCKTIYAMSTLSTKKIEDVGPATTFPKWYQLYVFKDFKINEDLIRRVEKCGFKAIVVTVDAPRLGKREGDIKNKFSLDIEGMSIEHLDKYMKSELKSQSGSGVSEFIKQNFDDTLEWSKITQLKQITKLPIIIKGVQTREDAILCLQHGVNGIIVSNHGGRQLDTTCSTIEMLPEIAEVCKGTSCEVFLDGGIRRGTDIVKALALGAKAVFVGRPYLWGLAVNGVDGIVDVIRILHEELVLAMRLTGCRNLSEIYGNLSILHNPPLPKARL